MSQLYLFGGSLAAILILAGVAWLLKLGGGGISSEAQAMAEAEAMVSGFDAVRARIGNDGRAALVEGADGSVALLKLHGAKLAVRRVVDPRIDAVEQGLRIDSGDARFGSVLVRGARGL